MTHDDDVQHESGGEPCYLDMLAYRIRKQAGDDLSVDYDPAKVVEQLDRILATIDRQSRLLAAYEAEHEAGIEVMHQHHLTLAEIEDGVGEHWDNVHEEWFEKHDHAEQVRKEEGL